MFRVWQVWIWKDKSGNSIDQGSTLDLAIEANCARRDPMPFMRMMSGLHDLNEREIQGIGKTLEASGSIGASACDPLWISLSQHCGRTSGAGCTEVFLKLLRSKADIALSRTWPRQKANGCGLTTFVNNYRDTLGLLFSAADLQTLMATNGDWAKALPEARRIVAQSVTGEVLFSFVLPLVSSDGLQDVMEQALTSFNPAHATVKMMSDVRDLLADEMDEMAESQTLPQSRVIKVKYMGHELSIRCSSIDYELEIRIAASIKMAALSSSASGLSRLPHEDWVLNAHTC